MQADTITRHRTKLTSLTLQSLKKMTAMIEDVHKPPVKLAHGHYDSLEDMRLEADIDGWLAALRADWPIVRMRDPFSPMMIAFCVARET